MDVSFHILSVMDAKLGVQKGTLAGLSRSEDSDRSPLVPRQQCRRLLAPYLLTRRDVAMYLTPR